jgi:murein DD-endopeptidase MepM/ murein hydrolase activator NlpD
VQFLDDMNRLFVPREILLRTDGRVRYITITRRQQLAAAGCVAAFLGWTVLSSAGVLVTSHLLRTRGDQVRQATAAYEDLRAQIIESRERFAALASELAAHQRYMLDLAGRAGDSAARAAPPPPLTKSPVASDSVAAILDGFHGALRRLSDDNRLIEREIAAVNGELAAAGESREHAAAARDRFAARWLDAEAKLATAGRTNNALNAQVADLEDRLSSLQLVQSRNVAAQQALKDHIASLEDELATTNADKTRLADAVTGMQRTVALLANDRTQLRAARDELASRFGALENRLSTVQLTQDRVVQKLTERARINVDEVEKTVAMTGLDVNNLLGSAAKQLSANVGGPFIAPSRRFRSAEELKILASVDKLGGEVDRLEQLQLVLRTLPLVSPLDSYMVESSFGIRQDPINGKAAIHEGVDLKNQPGTPVLSTAPGKVVYAGWMGEYGRLVEIDHGLGIRTRYAHLKSISVKVGEEVSYRQEIGKLGSSGRVTGPHVHYEVRVNGKPYDPMNFLEAGKYVFKG